ncbi:hypothetical protein PHET_05125 [Paragonimus heterotremus]|uniref:SCP domain-containing protein n=1 Tax=Paragonimus heterotremus TaxID=100268 RepID=A0A8J4SPY3_9TREM|nr:hypothetical protein PHET_05125 [Paragonimus heterotremus]
MRHSTVLFKSLHVLLLITCKSLDPVKSTISTDEKELILSVHNVAREELLNCTFPGQPAAKTMPAFVWQDSLAGTARNLSESCVFQHNDNADRIVDNYTYVGQNLAGAPTVEM